MIAIKMMFAWGEITFFWEQLPGPHVATRLHV